MNRHDLARLASVCIVIFFCFISKGCTSRVSEAELGAELKRFFGNTFVGQYKIVESNQSFDFSDTLATVRVIFSEAGVKTMEKVIENESESVQRLKGNILINKRIHSGSGFDFMILYYEPGLAKARIQYGHE